MGEKKPNAWGLYDMHGNVEEWCAPRHPKEDGGGEAKEAGDPGQFGVLRGGSYFCTSIKCRSACRHVPVANLCGTGPMFGFRVVVIQSARTP